MTREQEILSLLAQFKKLGIDKQIDYDKFYLYSIITHSTAIEGSTVTEIENQLLFDEGISAKGRSMAEQLSSLILKNTGTSYQTALGGWKRENVPITDESIAV